VTGGEVQGVVTEGISIFNGIPIAATPAGDLLGKRPLRYKLGQESRRQMIGLACMQAASSQGNTASIGEDY